MKRSLKPNDTIDQTARRLLDSYASQIHEDVEAAAENPYFAMRVRSRIREMREMREQNISSWESAVMATKGWIVALGAAAILFLAASSLWQAPTALDRDGDDLSPSEELVGEIR